ncbi:MAG: hypothetical protein HYU51_00715 [Candidatus Rokubacteria bacterium]|nr:hypothetical protein [Candidatus Rokubacteria bacterium]
MESALVRALRQIDGEKVARHIATRSEYDRAFPLFFRALGDAVCARLWERFPDAMACVGEDYVSEARARWGHLARLPLDWVAFGFPGVLMWDMHVGVVADLTRETPTISVGPHGTAGVWTKLAPALEAIDWPAVTGQKLVFNDARVVGEKQLIEPPRALDLRDLAGEVTRLADRAVRYYEIVAPLPAAAGIVPPPPTG